MVLNLEQKEDEVVYGSVFKSEARDSKVIRVVTAQIWWQGKMHVYGYR